MLSVVILAGIKVPIALQKNIPALSISHITQRWSKRCATDAF